MISNLQSGLGSTGMLRWLASFSLCSVKVSILSRGLSSRVVRLLTWQLRGAMSQQSKISPPRPAPVRGAHQHFALMFYWSKQDTWPSFESKREGTTQGMEAGWHSSLEVPIITVNHSHSVISSSNRRK